MCRTINFRDAASLRLLGFDAASLRLAGFSDIAVVTAGYTAAELRDANFSTEQLRQAGLSDSALRVVGYHTEQQVGRLHTQLSLIECPFTSHTTLLAVFSSQADVLASLFRATEGGKWKDAQGWRELLRTKRVTDHTPAHLLPVAGAPTPGLQQQQQLSQRFLLAGLRGVRCDENSGEVVRIQLNSNNLSGQLPAGIGSLTSLTQLVLSDNHLGGICAVLLHPRSAALAHIYRALLYIPGVLPASLGLLVNLENLHLDGNQFEGEIPKSLKSLVHLVVLKLEKNKLSGEESSESIIY